MTVKHLESGKYYWVRLSEHAPWEIARVGEYSTGMEYTGLYAEFKERDPKKLYEIGPRIDVQPGMTVVKELPKVPSRNTFIAPGEVAKRILREIRSTTGGA